MAEARASQIVRSLVVDGSFVTAKQAPNDIDLIVIVASDHDLNADLRLPAYNIISKKRVQKRFAFDIVSVREGTRELDEAIEFFEQVRRAPNLRKGLLRIHL